MQAFVTVQNFGDIQQKLDLCDTIAQVTMLPANINESGNVFVECEVAKLGAFFTLLANNPATVWIEYTVQFG